MIVLTGGAGFIGSCLLWKLNQEGLRDILVVDDLGSSEKWKNLLGKEFTDYLEKDVFLKRLLADDLPSDIIAIFHIGALSSTTGTCLSDYIENNYEYSKSLAAYAVQKNIRFIYASSAATYGDGSRGYSDDHDGLSLLSPLNPYGFSKFLFDNWLLKNGMLSRVVGLKYFNVYGPNEYHKEDMRSVLCKSYDMVRRDKKIRLFKSHRGDVKDGEQKRDFIYVKDAVALTYFFLERPELCGIYNVGTGEAKSWNQMAASLFRAMDIPLDIEYIPMPETLRAKYQYFTEAQMTKFNSTGCEHQFHTLDEAICEYVGFLKEKTTL